MKVHEQVRKLFFSEFWDSKNDETHISYLYRMFPVHGDCQQLLIQYIHSYHLDWIHRALVNTVMNLQVP